MSCLVLLVFLRMFEPSITAASSNANYAISQESSKIKNSQSKKDDDSQISVPFETTSVSDEVGTSSDQSTSKSSSTSSSSSSDTGSDQPSSSSSPSESESGSSNSSSSETSSSASSSSASNSNTSASFDENKAPANDSDSGNGPSSSADSVRDLPAQSNKNGQNWRSSSFTSVSKANKNSLDSQNNEVRRVTNTYNKAQILAAGNYGNNSKAEKNSNEKPNTDIVDFTNGSTAYAPPPSTILKDDSHFTLNSFLYFAAVFLIILIFTIYGEIQDSRKYKIENNNRGRRRK